MKRIDAFLILTAFVASLIPSPSVRGLRFVGLAAGFHIWAVAHEEPWLKSQFADEWRVYGRPYPAGFRA